MKGIFRAFLLASSLVHVCRAADPHLRYFGFWLAGPTIPEADPKGVATHSHYIADTSGWTNIVQAGPADLSDAFFAQARGAGMKALLWIPHINPDDPAAPSAWSAFASSVAPHVGDVAGFLVASEPYGATEIYGATPQQVSATIERIAAVVRRRFPGVPLYANFTPESYSNGQAVPKGLDVVSFDAYGCDAACVTTTMPSMVQTLKSRFPGSKVALLPTAWYNSAGAPNFSEPQLEEIADAYLRLAQSDPDIVALLPFEWWSARYDTAGQADPSIFLGTRDISKLRQKWAGIGLRILSGQSGFGTLCVTANSNQAYFVQGPDNFGWNGSHCWSGHTPGTYHIGATGAFVAPAHADLKAGGTTYFAVTFPSAGPGIAVASAPATAVSANTAAADCVPGQSCAGAAKSDATLMGSATPPARGTPAASAESPETVSAAPQPARAPPSGSSISSHASSGLVQPGGSAPAGSSGASRPNVPAGSVSAGAPGSWNPALGGSVPAAGQACPAMRRLQDPRALGCYARAAAARGMTDTACATAADALANQVARSLQDSVATLGSSAGGSAAAVSDMAFTREGCEASVGSLASPTPAGSASKAP